MDMSTSQLSPEQIRFIDDLASLLTAWTMPANAARLYGYLQIMNAPVSLEDIARDVLETDRCIHDLEIAVEARGIRRHGPCGEQAGEIVDEPDLLRRKLAG